MLFFHQHWNSPVIQFLLWLANFFIFVQTILIIFDLIWSSLDHMFSVYDQLFRIWLKLGSTFSFSKFIVQLLKWAFFILIWYVFHRNHLNNFYLSRKTLVEYGSTIFISRPFFLLHFSPGCQKGGACWRNWSWVCEYISHRRSSS